MLDECQEAWTNLDQDSCGGPFGCALALGLEYYTYSKTLKLAGSSDYR